MYSAEELSDLKIVYPKELKQIIIRDLRNVTFIGGCKLYMRGSITGRTSDGKASAVQNNVHV